MEQLPVPQGIQVNGFDGLVAVVLAAGLFVGKKRGMSVELLDLLQWLLIVVIGGLYHEPLGKLLSSAAKMSLVVAYIICYVTIGVGIKISFSYLKRALGEKLVGSDIFGRAEFYLGMLAGMVRFACMVLFGFSLLNAWYIDPAKIDAGIAKQKEELGSTFFPSFGEIQRAIVYKSATGNFVRKHLQEQIIPATPYVAQALPAAGKQREKEVWDAIDGKAPPKK
ncbi:MAG: CvpA family protein [Verrucomicrobiota bacterium]